MLPIARVEEKLPTLRRNSRGGFGGAYESGLRRFIGVLVWGADGASRRLVSGWHRHNYN